MLDRPVRDCAHTLLDGRVLRGDARHAKESLGALDLAIEPVVVRAIGARPPRAAGRGGHRETRGWRQVDTGSHAGMVALFVLAQRPLGVPGEAPRHGGSVVHWHPGEAAHARFRVLAAATVERVVERHHEVRDTPVVALLVGDTSRANAQAIRRFEQRKVRTLVEAVPLARAHAARIHVEWRVQKAGVTGVDSALDSLHPVALLDAL